MIAFVRNLFFRDFLLKLFSLVLAVLIWKIVSLAISHEVSPETGNLSGVERTFKDVPVLVVSPAEDVRNFKVDPTTVEVMVRIDRQRNAEVDPAEIRAVVDLTGIESARDLKQQIRVTTPPGVTFVRVIPEQANVIVPPKK